MLAFLSFFGIFLSLILLFHAKQFRSSVYLSLFYLFSSLYVLYQYILLYSHSATLISIFLFSLPIVGSPLYLIGPLLYFYVRSVLTDDSKLKRNDAWHLLPMIIFFIAALPVVFLPWNEKVELARKAAEDTSFVGQYQATLLAKVFPQVWVFASRLILILGYTLWAFHLLVTYIRENKKSVVLSRQHFVEKWMFLLLGFLILVLLTQILMIFKSFQLQFREFYQALKAIQGLSLFGLIGLLISPFFFPAILYGLPRVPQTVASARTKPIDAEQTVVQAQRNRLNFEADYLKHIDEKAHEVMKEQRPYLHPDCNLAYFSKLLNVPAHHLAYYFREIKKQPFNDFRNRWRINHAKTLIEEGKANEVTLEAIGFLSGFSSRNAFITDFKKFEGVSPGSFAARNN